MPDYNESQVAGHVWQRAHQIVIDNVRGTPPTIRFDEERVVAFEDGTEIRNPLGSLVVPFDPAKQVPLLNPLTGEPTSTSISHGEVYAIIYSAYIAAASERDAALAPPAAPV